ncbi:MULTISPECIES: nucleoside-diphosphate kinase [Amycolatopsis]|uniref:Nucleoside diphosphate kinase n=1 Tax=Amycolatopsis rubida TaxID=112413 RepID=A0A1I5ZBQ2_9PSEU|nr:MULTISPECIES: nucleoside-diphosphate kinase [Amycolatopsis]OAP26121.1 Nucleoside diphosphate kinase [Amycolatopsis sp. M39]SFQ53926.1 Nucleoside diphosphate kinase [Amycolatopsis rubida]
MPSADHALAVLLPDAVRLGLVPALGEELQARGFFPVACRSLQLDEEHLSTLYAGTRSKTSESGRQYGVLLTARLAAMDSSLAVVLGRRDGRDASRTLHDAKGASVPFERAPGTLRWLSRVSGRCLSLLHTPDDFAEARRDIAALFAPMGIDEVVAMDRRPSWREIADLRAYVPPGDESSRHSAVVTAILRLSVALTVDTAQSVGLGFPEVAALARDFLADAPATDPFDEAKRFACFCDQARERATAGYSPRPSPGSFGHLLTALVDPRCHSLRLGFELVRAMESAGFRLTDFEQQRLLTSLAFHQSEYLKERLP